jgi:Do/DeqQ family serine protease
MNKKVKGLLVALALGAVSVVPTVNAQLPALQEGQPVPTLAPMLDQVTPAVVNISTTGRMRPQENPMFQDPFFRRFFEMPEAPRELVPQSLGSGVIVDAKNGYVLTNSHVVERAEEIFVTLQNGRELQAKLVGADPETDIAVLQVETDGANLAQIPFADDSKLRVGDFVVAIGNPFGLGQTVTSGIVSALGRTGLGIEGYEDFIQTDASINPGNSGGALVNLQGQLAGINTAILSPAGGNIGIGFAIPASMARTVMTQLIEHGEVRRGVLGVSVQDLNRELAQALDIEAEEGVVVAQVMEGSAAAKAGLKAGDVIVALNGQPVRRAAGIRNRIGLLRIGEEIHLTVVRDGKKQTVTATIQEGDGNGRAASAGAAPQLEGAQFGEVEDVPGLQGTRVAVVQVAPGSPAARAGLRRGDVIISVNRRTVNSLADFRQALQQSSGPALLHIRRGDGAFFLPLR